MGVVQKFRKQISPRTLKQSAGIPANTPERRDYWQALQMIRKWTRPTTTPSSRPWSRLRG